MVNKLILGDCLEVMGTLDDECIDLIYLDPPFNTGKDWGQFDDRWGERNAGIVSLDTALYLIDGIRMIHSDAMANYLSFMTRRLIECHRILKETGSLYLHCDQFAGHYIKIILDTIFGRDNFRNDLSWCYRTGGVSKKYFAKKKDTIFFYSKTGNYGFNAQLSKSYLKSQLRWSAKYEIQQDRHGSFQEIKYGSTDVKIYKDAGGYYRMIYSRDYWTDIDVPGRSDVERTGYPTQKPLKLLERIIKASSNKGDWVLDPFCGCATTMVAANRLQRKWIGIDINPEAIKIGKERLSLDTHI